MIFTLLSIVFLFLLLGFLFLRNQKLKKEIDILQELVAIKNTTISNFEASRLTVENVIENYSFIKDVKLLIDAGDSRESISEKLGISNERVETIVKLNSIKEEKKL